MKFLQANSMKRCAVIVHSKDIPTKYLFDKTTDLGFYLNVVKDCIPSLDIKDKAFSVIFTNEEDLQGKVSEMVGIPKDKLRMSTKIGVDDKNYIEITLFELN